MVRVLLFLILKYHIFFSKRERFFKSHKKVLLLVPHPDDEVIGAGGFMLQHKPEHTWVCFMTDGDASHAQYPPEQIAAARRDISSRVLAEMGIPEAHILRLGLPDGQLSELSEAVLQKAMADISAFIDAQQIEVVLTTHREDYWPFDHAATFELAKDLCREKGLPLYAYWVWAWVCMPWKRRFTFPLSKYHLLPISAQQARKKKLIEAYLVDKNPDGKPWSGVLPDLLIKANTWEYEVFEEIEIHGR